MNKLTFQQRIVLLRMGCEEGRSELAHHLGITRHELEAASRGEALTEATHALLTAALQQWDSKEPS